MGCLSRGAKLCWFPGQSELGQESVAAQGGSQGAWGRRGGSLLREVLWEGSGPWV